MRRRSSRTAAAVLAGCVGLAVLAPGMALAQEPVTPVCPDTQMLNEAGVCEDQANSDTDSAVPSGGSSSEQSNGSSAPSSGELPAESAPLPSTSLAPVIPDGSGSGGGETDGTGTGGIEESNDPGGAPAAAQAAPTLPESAVLADGNALTDQLSGLSGFEFPTDFVPGAGNLDLGGLVPPTTVPEGGFTNPREACAFLAGGIIAPAGQEESLGAAFESFCGSLPADFTSFDPTQLLNLLTELLGGLMPGAGGNGDGATVTPAGVEDDDYFSGYWRDGFDVDCSDVTFDEAQTILAYDGTDQFRLDRDDDGVACENNLDTVAAEEFVGFPIGGVSTGDGSTTAEGSPAATALAATALSGLALAGAGLVRRYRQES